MLNLNIYLHVFYRLIDANGNLLEKERYMLFASVWERVGFKVTGLMFVFAATECSIMPRQRWVKSTNIGCFFLPQYFLKIKKQIFENGPYMAAGGLIIHMIREVMQKYKSSCVCSSNCVIIWKIPLDYGSIIIKTKAEGDRTSFYF